MIFAIGEAGPLCMLFAATYPERTRALVLWATTPSFVRTREVPWLPSRGDYDARLAEVAARWGEREFNESLTRRANPDASDEEIRDFARVFRLSVSPGAAARYFALNADVDVTDILPSIRVPTLIMQRRDWAGFTPVGAADVRQMARYLASRIPDARLVEVPGRNFAPTLGSQDELFAELERLVAVTAEPTHAEPEPDRVLATVLFTDIVGSTAKAAELGDATWRDLITRHHELIRRELVRYRGREMDTAGDGFFATFDGPARAIRCAVSASQSVRELGIEIRSGLHTGECELLDDKVGGIAVNIGARVAAQAQPGEVLVSNTVKDLVAGSGIEFEDRGAHQFKGLDGEWHVFAVAAA